MTELYIFSQDDKLLTIISESTGLIEAPFREELNAGSSFSFTAEAQTQYKHVYDKQRGALTQVASMFIGTTESAESERVNVSPAQYIVEENQVVFRDHEGDLRLYVIKEVDDIDNTDGAETTATCEPAFMELRENIVVDRRFVDQTADKALDAALEGTRWTGKVEVELFEGTTNFYYIDSVEALEKIVNTWGGEFKDVVTFDDRNNIKSRQIIIKQRLGGDNGLRFDIDHNTEEIQRTVLSYPLTALYGRGASLELEDEEGEATGGHSRYIDFADIEWKKSKGDPVDKPLGQKWVGDPKALEKYGRLHKGELLHRYGIFSNQDFEDEAELLQATWDELQEKQQVEVNYHLKVYLMDKTVSLGDTAQAIDRQFARPIEIQTRIISLSYDLMDIDGTMEAEMGQFLSAHTDDPIRDLEGKIDDVRDKIDQPITNGRFPDIKPGIPTNIDTAGGMETIQLYWDYDSKVYVSHYEVYGSQVKDFVPDSQHLLWRGNVSAFAHTVGTDQSWYYYLRAVNTRGTAGDFSQRVSASTHRVISDDILFGEELAERLRELSKLSSIIADGSLSFEQISDQAKDLLKQESKQYTDEEIRITKSDLLSDISDLSNDLEYVNGQLVDKVNTGDVYIKAEIDGMFNNTVSVLQYEADQEGIVQDLKHQLSLIEQTEKAIGLKVEQTDFDNETGYLRNSITDVKLFAEGLESTVSNIQIGGRNLIRNGDFTNEDKFWERSGSSQGNHIIQVETGLPTFNYHARLESHGILTGDFFWAQYDVGFYKGKTYTLSVQGYSQAGVWSIQYGNAELGYTSVESSGKLKTWETLELTFEAPADNFRIYVGYKQRYNSAPVNGVFTAVQIEHGTMASDWTPNPADTDERMSISESTIKQLSKEIELKVDVDEIVSRINLSEEGVRIQGNLIHLDGLTLIDEGIIQSVHIANAAIEKAHLGIAVVDTLQVADGAITNLKVGKLAVDDSHIANLSAVKITTGEIDGNKVRIRGGSATDYTLIDGSYLESRGRFTRTFLGSTTTYDVKMKLENGYLRARNDSLNRSVYYSEYGISTQVDGVGETDDSTGASGSLLFWDKRYSPSGANGITLNSHGGVAAVTSNLSRVLLQAASSVRLESKQDAIYIRPKVDTQSTNRTFDFTTGDADADGYLMYGGIGDRFVGFRMYRGGSIPRIAVVDGNQARGGSTLFDVGNVATNSIWKRDGSHSVYWNNSSGPTTSGTGVDQENTLYASGIRVRSNDADMILATDLGGAVRITDYAGFNSGNGLNYRDIYAREFKTVSSEKYKEDISKWDITALDRINESVIYQYLMKNAEDPNQAYKYGLIIERETPTEIVSGDAISQYGMSSLMFKGIQELSKQDDLISEEINWLKIENQYLKTEIKQLKEKIA